MFVGLTGRPRDQRESEILDEIYEEQCAEFEESPDEADALLEIGDHPVASGLHHSGRRHDHGCPSHFGK